MTLQNEKEKQQGYSWRRSVNFAGYNTILGYYQAQSCLEQSSGPNVLDLACGDGTITELFSRNFGRVVGVDRVQQKSGHGKEKAATCGIPRESY